jgi:hypothetical protein
MGRGRSRRYSDGAQVENVDLRYGWDDLEEQIEYANLPRLKGDRR